MDESLSPAQRSKIRRLSASRPAEQAAGELNVVPYLDIITNVMMFVLATIAVTFVSAVDVKAPEVSPRPGPETSALGLTAFIVPSGVSLKTSSGNVATGCRGVGQGVAVPRAADGQDLDAITACARQLKHARPQFEEETQVTVTANPGTPLQEVVAVMDALRGEQNAPLFPEVHFGLPR